jgi:hypothetical protein
MPIVTAKTLPLLIDGAEKLAKTVMHILTHAHPVVLEVLNDTETDHKTLELHDAYFDSGRWGEDPPDHTIPVLEGSVFGAENRTAAGTGAIGTVSYKITPTEKDDYLLIYFSNPLVGGYKAGARIVGKKSGHSDVSAEHWFGYLSSHYTESSDHSEAHDLKVTYSAGPDMRFTLTSTKN